MFLEKIELSYVAPCIVEANKVRAEANLSRDVSEIMPYLNSIIKKATYIKGKPLITFPKNSRVITLHPRRVMIIKALNSTDVMQVLDLLRDLINETYEKKNEIEPCYESRVHSTLEVFSRLPKTNCGQCGEKTCLAFATKLLRWEQELKNCRPLFTAEYEKLRKPLMEILEPLGFEIHPEMKE